METLNSQTLSITDEKRETHNLEQTPKFGLWWRKLVKYVNVNLKYHMCLSGKSSQYSYLLLTEYSDSSNIGFWVIYQQNFDQIKY